MTESDCVRASDSEREAAVERLRAASVEGRLTLGELTARTEAAYSAQTRGELVRITADLPEGQSGSALAPDLSSGVVEKVITSELFQVPSTAALHGSRLAVVNAKFDTGVPPTADQYEVVLVER